GGVANLATRQRGEALKVTAAVAQWLQAVGAELARDVVRAAPQARRLDAAPFQLIGSEIGNVGERLTTVDARAFWCNLARHMRAAEREHERAQLRSCHRGVHSEMEFVASQRVERHCSQGGARSSIFCQSGRGPDQLCSAGRPATKGMRT